MPEQVAEPKEDQATPDADKLLEEGLDNLEGKETPEESSPSKEPTEPESKETEEAGDDQPKKSESEETKEEGEKTEKDADPADLAFRAKWNKAKEKLEATHQSKITELEGRMLSKEDVENFKKTTSSSAYIRESMKADGYTQEAIDTRLRESGFNVPTKGVDEVALIAKEFGVAPESLSKEERDWAQNQAKAFKALYKHHIGQDLPAHSKPIEESLSKITGERESNQIFDTLEKQVKDEGVLDFDKDVMPEVNKWLDANEKNTNTNRDDFSKHVQNVIHSLTIDRLKTGKRKENRDKTKEKQRGNEGTQVIQGDNKMPKSTGKFDDDLASGLDILYPND